MQLLNKITNLGIKEKHSLSEKKRIKLLNRIVLLFTALVSVSPLLSVMTNLAFFFPPFPFLAVFLAPSLEGSPAFLDFLASSFAFLTSSKA